MIKFARKCRAENSQSSLEQERKGEPKELGGEGWGRWAGQEAESAKGHKNPEERGTTPSFESSAAYRTNQESTISIPHLGLMGNQASFPEDSLNLTVGKVSFARVIVPVPYLHEGEASPEILDTKGSSPLSCRLL